MNSHKPHRKHHQHLRKKLKHQVEEDAASEPTINKKGVKKTRFLWRAFGTALILGVGLASLICAAWALGFTPFNTHQNLNRIELYLPKLPDSKIFASVSAHLDSERSTFLSRHFSSFSEATNFDESSTDHILIQFMILGEKNQSLTDDYVLKTNQAISLTTTFPIKRFYNYNNYSKHEFYPYYKSEDSEGFHYSILRDKLEIDESTSSALFYVEPDKELAEKRGLASISYVQKFQVTSDLQSKIVFSSITNAIIFPFRFDDIKADANNVTQSKLISNWAREIVTGEENPELLDHVSVLQIECTDVDAKRLEDFIIFISGAVFGVAVGAMFEIVLALVKEKGFE